MNRIILTFILILACFMCVKSSTTIDENERLLLMLKYFEKDSLAKKHLLKDVNAEYCYELDTISLCFNLFTSLSLKDTIIVNRILSKFVDTSKLSNRNKFRELFKFDSVRRENFRSQRLFNINSIMKKDCKIKLYISYDKIDNDFYKLMLNSNDLWYNGLELLFIFDNKNKIIFYKKNEIM